MDSTVVLFFQQKLFAMQITKDGKYNRKVSSVACESFLFYVLLYVYILSIAKSIDNELTKV